jgi:hypothetical protein
VGRKSSRDQRARQRARSRQVALDGDRAAQRPGAEDGVLALRELFRRQRVVEVAADGFLALGEHTEAAAALAAVEAKVGAVLRRLLAEGEDVDRVAALLELPAADVWRFLTVAQSEEHPADVRADTAVGRRPLRAAYRHPPLDVQDFVDSRDCRSAEDSAGTHCVQAGEASRTECRAAGSSGPTASRTIGTCPHLYQGEEVGLPEVQDLPDVAIELVADGRPLMYPGGGADQIHR